ncbi:GLE1-like protein-domain-containing protein [Pseudomassariella vexata]|uniref:mRNA export factor GLE1 n=1 Tax=Pseudomassariella vexata TaxID=1141098 RepID=A0A1Y2EIS7_9PEZI|nr:GLE1-like protein-domain-containing protein [Pseudomassariella vexata]ORY71214.1 GLE1-like protein-domain-containing protein [Pseudomassariella vexata]
MADSSPAPRRSAQWSSPDQTRFSDFLSDDRNSELNHKEALAKARAEHDRVRDEAVRVIRLHEHQLELQRLREQELHVLAAQRKEEERLLREKKLRDEEQRLRDLEAQSIPKLPPKPPRPPLQEAAAPQPIVNGAGPVPKPATAVEHPGIASTAVPFAPLPTPSAPQVNGHASKVTETAPGLTPTAPSPFSKSTSAVSNPFTQLTPGPAVNGSTTAAPAQEVKPAIPSAPIQPLVAQGDRYAEIHKNLKQLRAYLLEQTKSNMALKTRMGDMRREIRKSLGQLTGGKGANKQQLERIKGLLSEALSGQVPSALVDPSDYTVDKREPVEGAVHNAPQLPSLFLYLLNALAKGIINQFINECGAAPRNADPVGVIAAQMFSMKDFHWRGKSLIDILMAKFRIVCPVVFGYRGSEKTEQGRARLGWKKEGGAWITEQQHIDRMTGLGVGYASLALRDFSRSPNTNPWPPSRYWTTMASIVNTPPAEISNTQCVVLKSMIQLYEEKFIHLYGSAAIVALRRALVEFPGKAPNNTPGVGGLQVVAQMYKRDLGLDLN